MSTPRTYLEQGIRASVPKSWKIVPYEDSFDVPSAVTIMIRQVGFQKFEGAPLGAVATNFVVSLISPHADAKKAEAALDRDSLNLYRWIDDIPNGLAIEAEKVQATEMSMAYDITCQIITQREGG